MTLQNLCAIISSDQCSNGFVDDWLINVSDQLNNYSE